MTVHRGAWLPGWLVVGNQWIPSCADQVVGKLVKLEGLVAVGVATDGLDAGGECPALRLDVLSKDV